MRNNTGTGSAAQPYDTAGIERASFDAARSIVDDAATQAPIIDGIVGHTLVEEFTDVITINERGVDVQWRISKGYFIDEDGNRLQIASRLPNRKLKREDDFEYILGSARVVVGGNIAHIAASVSQGQIINNDEEMTAVLPTHPVGFTKMFQSIYESSKSIAESENTKASFSKSERRHKIARAARFVLSVGALAGIGIFGAPKVAEEYYDYKESEQAQEAQKTEQEARATQLSIDQFDAEYQTIEEGVSLKDEERSLVPVTRQFVLAESIPRYDAELSPSQLSNVRAVQAPSIGESVGYSIPIPENQSITVAHTGDSRLLVTAVIDESTQTITINSIDLGIELTEDSPEILTGDIVLTFSE